MPPEARGTREFSSPQVRVRSEQSPGYHPRRRLLLPNERRRRFSLRRAVVGVAVPLLALAGVGVGVYFGVSYLLRDDEAAPAAQTEAPAAQTTAEGEAGASEADAPTEAAAAATPAAAQSEPEPAAASATPAAAGAADEQAAQQSSEPVEAAGEPAVHPARVEPTVAAEPVAPSAVGGAPLVGERMTAEALPAGIPRRLADDTPYDPADATAAFSNLWPTGTTLRLTRLPGAPLLNEEQAGQVVGAEALVVIRGSENSNTDIQLSAASFEQLGFFETERIIAVRAEVVGAPP